MYLPARQIVGSGTAMTLMGATATSATGDMSAAITSDPVDCQAIAYGCIEAVWNATGGSPVGTFVVEACGGSWNQDRPALINWIDITSLLTPALPAVSGAGSFIANLGNLGFRGVRLRYVRTSGGAANQLSVWFNGKSAAG